MRAPMPVMRDAGTGAASRGAKTLICNARIASRTPGVVRAASRARWPAAFAGMFDKKPSRTG
ncbi:hypothetical protein WS91_20615 [Burkholderia sp. MSMB1498]|nr:hypothetical protein WS91_20615 [Burkholderia sp. MSMB1498]